MIVNQRYKKRSLIVFKNDRFLFRFLLEEKIDRFYKQLTTVFYTIVFKKQKIVIVKYVNDR